MFASEATCTISTTLATTGVNIASLANIIPALISTTLATMGVHVASLATHARGNKRC
jgi:hypothetical protein